MPEKLSDVDGDMNTYFKTKEELDPVWESVAKSLKGLEGLAQHKESKPFAKSLHGMLKGTYDDGSNAPVFNEEANDQYNPCAWDTSKPGSASAAVHIATSGMSVSSAMLTKIYTNWVRAYSWGNWPTLNSDRRDAFRSLLLHKADPGHDPGGTDWKNPASRYIPTTLSEYPSVLDPQGAFYKAFNQKFGGKAASLMLMSILGLEVPRGAAIPVQSVMSEVPTSYSSHLTASRRNAIERILDNLTADDTGNLPSLYAVRSGAAVSMPGMMDTVINVGITDKDTYAAYQAKDAELAERLLWGFYSTYFSALGLEGKKIDLVQRAVKFSALTGAKHWKEQVKLLRKVAAEDGFKNATDTHRVLFNCMIAVKRSFESERCISYRKHNGLEVDGTAVIIQKMVIGTGQNSGTGVVSSHNPAPSETSVPDSSGREVFQKDEVGSPILYGEFLNDAQGEDLVSGSKPGKPIRSLAYDFSGTLARELSDGVLLLAMIYDCNVDVEWTIQDGKLWFLQVRPMKSAPEAKIQAASCIQTLRSYRLQRARSKAYSHYLDKEVATLSGQWNMTTMRKLGSLLKLNYAVSKKAGPAVEMSNDLKKSDATVVLTGQPVGPNVSPVAPIISDPYKAEKMAKKKEPYIWHSNYTTPDDYTCMINSVGVVTVEGGTMSHAALVAREEEIPTVVGVSNNKLLSELGQGKTNPFGFIEEGSLYAYY